MVEMGTGELLMDSMARWCSSKAPWRARTPMVIDGGLLLVMMMIVMPY